MTMFLATACVYVNVSVMSLGYTTDEYGTLHMTCVRSELPLALATPSVTS